MLGCKPQVFILCQILQAEITSAYAKDFKYYKGIRREHQEYPNKRFDEVLNEKLPTTIKMRT